jgi:predicted RNA-binding Zn-ribbon protein involved in translation (DUF1610 family)
VDGEAKICRACGGILAEVPDGPKPDAASPPEVRRPRVPPLTTESPIAEPDAAWVIVDASLADEDANSAEPVELPDWSCPQCGESVPGTFDVCWKCLTARGGETANQEEIQFLRELSDGNDDDSASAATRVPSAVVGQEGIDKAPRAEPPCPRCGSSLMMRGVTVRDQGDLPPAEALPSAEPIDCLQCGARIKAGQSKCPKCGWSYNEDQGPV